MHLVVEQGHCYRTTGATGTTGEQDFAVATAAAIVRHVHGHAGWTVGVKLADSGSYKGDAFVALHCDGSTNPAARGASIGWQSSPGRDFGRATLTAYAARGWTGGFRPDNYTAALAGYYGVRNAINAGNPRAFILESGFLTNPDDRALLAAPAGPDRVALSVADALGITHTTIQEDDDMADFDPIELPPSPVDADGTLLVVSKTIHLPWAPSSGTGVNKVWVSLFASNSPLHINVAHYRVLNDDNVTTHLVGFVPDHTVIDPMCLARKLSDTAPPRAVALVIDYVSAVGGSVGVESAK